MTVHAYVFEAKAIQRYITDGGRLKDVTGASALLHALTESSGPLDKAMQAAGLQGGDAILARRAGGAFILVDRDTGTDTKLRRFRALWRLYVGAAVPGLVFADALGQADSAHAAVESAQIKARGGFRMEWPDRPPIGPLTMLAQRTGRAAVKTDDHDQTEFLDAAQARKRADLDRAKLALGRHLAPTAAAGAWPDEVEDMIPEGFPRRTLAVLHIDANGMGEHLKAIAEKAQNESEPFEKQVREFSNMVEEAIRESAQAASEVALANGNVKRGKKGCIPARPIVLAGDELTLVMRADCALPFMKTYVKHAEQKVSGRNLSFGAGIAFVHVRHPFSDAVDLAASLCAFAKREARRRLRARGSGSDIPSVVAFHRALEARDGDYAQILSRDLTVNASMRLTLGPYWIKTPANSDDARTNSDPTGRLPTLEGLETLMGVLSEDEASRGPLRRCLADLQQGAKQNADNTFQRWRQVVPETTRTALDGAISCGLSPQGTRTQAPTLFIDVEGRFATALADAQALLAAAGPPRKPVPDPTPKMEVGS